MWRNKGTFLAAAVVLTLASIVYADIVITVNGVDAAEEPFEKKGKDNLVIAVAGSTEAEAGDYYIKLNGGVIGEIAGDDANSTAVKKEYAFAFADELELCIASLIVDKDSVIDGIAVKGGETIYELVIYRIPETDIVKAFGDDLANLDSYKQAEAEAAQEAAIEAAPESTPAAKPEAYSEQEVKAAPRPKPMSPLQERRAKRAHNLRKFSAIAGNSSNLAAEDELCPESWRGLPATARQAGDVLAAGSMEQFLTEQQEFDEDLAVIDANTVINTNTVWDTDVLLMGYVYVDNAMLIIKPGVTVWVAYTEGRGGIDVRNNGVIKAKGVPGGAITFRSEFDYAWFGYNYAIKIEETASSLCEISYCNITCSLIGIYIKNNRLIKPVQNNQLWYCFLGIVQDGPKLTDVINNLIIDGYLVGIGAHLDDVNGVASNTTEILIENNTIVGSWYYGWGQDYGIYIGGVEQPDDAGKVVITNNLVAGSYYYAIVLVNGWMEVYRICNGYYANYYIVHGNPEVGFPDIGGTPVENFDSYVSSDALRAVWKSYLENGSGADVYLNDDPNFVRDGNSMSYIYYNGDSPYYSEAYADVNDLPSEIGSDWSGDANMLSLYFYGKHYNEAGEQMYVKLTDGDESADFGVVDDFESYGSSSTALRAVWQESLASTFVCLNEGVAIYGNSMELEYKNFKSPYYAEVGATMTALRFGSNWSGTGEEALSLWFCGKATNDANEQMYIKLTDGSSPAETATVFYGDYGDMNDIRKEVWRPWDIPLAYFYFANPNFNFANVAKISIGFGDGTSPGGEPNGSGNVYFEDIRLYPEYPQRKHTAKVAYDGDMNDVKEEGWHRWIIPLEEFTDVNLANVARITIGFGDGNKPEGEGPWNISGVYFDNIRLHSRVPEDPNIPAGDVSPQVLTEDPFVNGYYDYPYFLKQDCNLIDAGYKYIDETGLMGRSTSANWIPDSDVADIGFHYMNWGYVNAGDGNALEADLNFDDAVNFGDFAVIAGGWLTDYDVNDLHTMVEEWLRAAGPNIALSLNQDPNFVTNALTITLDNDSNEEDNYDITYHLLMDGQYYGSFYGGDIAIPTYEYCNGQHELKVVGISLGSKVFVAPVISIKVNNNLQCLTGSETYGYNQAYRFAGFYEPNDGGMLNFEIKDLNDDVIWTNSSSGNFNFEVPVGVLQSPYNELIIQESASAGGSFKGIGETSEGSEWDGWIKDITKEFNVTSDPNCSNARSLLVGVKKGHRIPGTGIGIGDWTYNRKEVWREYLNACKKKNLGPTICLFFGQATRKNIETALSQSEVEAVMIITDGNRKVGNTHRTFFDAWDGLYFSCLRRNGDSPGASKPLPEKYEKGYSVWDLKGSFEERDRMYVFIDACKNGTSCMPPEYFESINVPEPADNNFSIGEYDKTSDMANAFDISRDTSGTRFYMGWRGEAFKDCPILHYNNFLRTIWEDVGGSNPLNSKFNDAIADATFYNQGTRIPAANFSFVGNINIYFGQ